MGHNPQKIKERILKREKQNITENKNNPTNTFVGVDALVGLPPLQPNEIYNDDSFKLIERVPAKTVDLILEDMPYNTTACEWDVKIDLELYWKTRLRILKPAGVIALTARQPFTSMIVMSNLPMYKHKWTWNKKQSGSFQNAKYMPLQIEEDILIFGEGRINYYPIMKKGKLRVKGGSKKENEIADGLGSNHITINDDYYPTNIIDDFPNCSNKNENFHPTQKPAGLFEYLIRTYTNEGDLVFDGFGGSGTTAIAAHKSKRNFIVIEKEKKYFDLAKRRLDNERAQLTML